MHILCVELQYYMEFFKKFKLQTTCHLQQALEIKKK